MEDNGGATMATTLYTLMDMRNFVPGSTHTVEVTHIIDPKNFYVRPLSVTDYVPLLETPGSPITVGDVNISKSVIFKSETLKKYVRGVIESISTEENCPSCVIFAVDYGFRETCMESKHIRLPKSTWCPPLALHCELQMCEPRGSEFTELAIEVMKCFVGKNNLVMRIKFKMRNKYTVMLENPTRLYYDASCTLAIFTGTKAVRVNNEVDEYARASMLTEVIYYKSQDLKVGDKLLVRVQSGDSINSFYVAEINNYDKYIREAQNFSSYCEGQPVQDVYSAAADGRACGVRVDEEIIYERAIVCKVTDFARKALVNLIDRGKQIEVNSEQIKCIQLANYAKLPPISIHCASEQKSVWQSIFLFPGYQFYIEIVEVGNGDGKPYKVKMTPV